MGRSLWAQASQEKDREEGHQVERDGAGAITAKRSATSKRCARAVCGLMKSRTTFLATTKDVFDEAATAFAEMALLTAPAAATAAPLDGKALEYAAEGFKIIEQSRARSLLDLLSETGLRSPKVFPRICSSAKQDNLDRQQEIAEELIGNQSHRRRARRKPSDLEGATRKAAD